MPRNRICLSSLTSAILHGPNHQRHPTQLHRSRWVMIPARQRPWDRDRLPAGSTGLIRSDDFIRPHHVVVLMLEHVAMKHIAARVTIEANQNGEHVSGTDHGGVLPARFTGLRFSWLANKL